MHELTEHLTMAQAAKVLPSHPSPNCLWRWCRKGVKSRSGERVHLQHVRLGGVIFTTAAWVEEFGSRLAQADVEHFDLGEQDILIHRPGHSQPYTNKQRVAHLEQVQRELAEAGI